MRQFLVIDVGGTFLKYARMDEECNILKKDKCPTPKHSRDEFVDALYEIFKQYRGSVQGIAISSAGVINSSTGYVKNGGSLLYLKDVDLKKELEERCRVPVSIENDAKCAALAEVWKGALRDCSNAIVFIIGTAVGGAVILNRRVLSGNNLMAGEFSYLLTDANDAKNPEKTFAKRGGMPYLLELANKRLHMEERKLDGEELFSLAQEGNETARSCIREFARQLAVQIVNLQFILDPERVAVGGGVSAQPLLITMIREEIAELTSVYPHPVPQPNITACQFFNDSNLIGALYAHLQQ